MKFNKDYDRIIDNRGAIWSEYIIKGGNPLVGK